jgi:Cu/Ag efflux pump CusA
VLSTGAGSEMRRAIGVAVFFGMLGVTAFGLVLTPVFYVLVRRLVEGGENKKVATNTDLSGATSVEA